MRRILPSLVLALFLGACQQPPPVPGTLPATGETFVTVNGQPLTKSMLDAVTRTLPPSLLAQIEQQGGQDAIKESLITNELLYRESLKRNLQLDPLIKEQMALAERNALAESLVRKVVEERLTQDRIKKYYDEHAVQYAQPQLRLAHIVVSDAKKATEIITKAKAGEDFAQLAQSNSEDPATARNGGEISGWIELAQLTDTLKGPISTAKGGDIVGPVSMMNKQFVFKVLERRDSVPLADVQDDVKRDLEAEIRNEFMKELKDKATITQATVGAAAPGAVAPGAKAPASGAPPAKAPAAGAPPTPSKAPPAGAPPAPEAPKKP